MAGLPQFSGHLFEIDPAFLIAVIDEGSNDGGQQSFIPPWESLASQTFGNEQGLIQPQL
jgi:hypothetical protein